MTEAQANAGPKKRGPKPMPAHEKAKRLEEQRLRHNAKRRLSYRTDPAYAAKERKAARDRFRLLNNTEIGYDSRNSLSSLRENATQRAVYLHRFELWGEAPTFTIKELCNEKGSDEYGVLGVSVKTLNKWITDNLIPAPILSAYVVTNSFGRIGQTSIVRVYHEDEVRAMIGPLGKHQAQIKVFRTEHQTLVQEIHEVIEQVRKEKGFS